MIELKQLLCIRSKFGSKFMRQRGLLLFIKINIKSEMYKKYPTFGPIAIIFLFLPIRPQTVMAQCWSCAGRAPRLLI